MGCYYIRDFGAVGDGITNDAAAIQKAIDECSFNGGGKVIVTAGKYMSGSIEIKSNVNLHLESGASLIASPEIRDYSFRIEGVKRRYFIYSLDAENISITGRGTIDGNGRSYVNIDRKHIFRMKVGRPFTVMLINSKNITIKDINIADGAVWTLTLSGCEDVLIHGIRILNDMRVPNSDGIDVDHCRNLRISDCHLECGDDCIVFKNTTFFGGKGPCENITVTGCTMVSNSFAINMGCEVAEPIRNIIVDSCVIKNSHRGIGIHLSQKDNIENIIFSNMIVETRYQNPDWWGAAEPIYVVSIPWTENDTVGYVKNIRFVNILCKSENGAFIQGWKDYIVDGIILDNVRIELGKWSSEKGGRHDIRPCPGEADGRAVGVYDYPTNGFYIKDINGSVTLRNCELVWDSASTQDYFKHAIEAHNVRNLYIENFKGEAANPGKDEVIYRD